MADNNDNDATPPPPPPLNNVDDDSNPPDAPQEDFASFLIRTRVEVPFMGENKNLPTIEELSKLQHPRVWLRPPIQRHQQQGEQSVSTDADTLHSNMEGLSTNTNEDVNEEGLSEYVP
jgi:hypothetical protein